MHCDDKKNFTLYSRCAVSNSIMIFKKLGKDICENCLKFILHQKTFFSLFLPLMKLIPNWRIEAIDIIYK